MGNSYDSGWPITGAMSSRFRIASGPGLLIRNELTWRVGRKSSVKAVATAKPPISPSAPRSTVMSGRDGPLV